MENDLTDRIPFRIESKRGDDMDGTNARTGAVITDFEAKEKGEYLFNPAFSGTRYRKQ